MAVNLFGTFALTTADGRPIKIPTRKTALVWAVLALLGEKGATRGSLAEWIWPDRQEGQARASLRQALAAIRRTLPDVLSEYSIETELDYIRLVGPAGDIDCRSFDALCRSDSLSDLVTAAHLYQGDLLDGIAMELQLETVIQSYRRQFRQQALTLAETLSLGADLMPAQRVTCEELAERLLSREPSAEEAHRALIRLRLAAGQSNAARRQLDLCIAALKDELGTEPENRTLQLISLPGNLASSGHVSGNRVQPSEPSAAAPSALIVSSPESAMPLGSLGTRPSLVVMPFDDLCPEEDDYFVDGVVEEITSALSRVRDFFVIARQSAYTYKGRFVDVRQVGQDLGVRYAVEGTVRRGGSKVRITVQLVETQSGVQLWSDRYEGDTAELFDLQDRIASHVAGAINPSIRASEIEFANRLPPDNLQAYDLFLRGLPHFWSQRKEDNERALDLFDQALDRDPKYGVARAFKAWCHAQQACYMWSDDPRRERELAIAAANLAAQKVGDHATALVAVGAALSMTTTDQELSASFVERGLAIDPNNAWGWMRSGWVKVLFRQVDNAIECFERGLALSPFDPFTYNMYFGMAAAYAELGNFEKAIELAERGLRAGVGVTWAYRMLAYYNAMIERDEEAAKAVQILMQHYPDMTIKKMRKSVPPFLNQSNQTYWDGMRRAGIPEG